MSPLLLLIACQSSAPASFVRPGEAPPTNRPRPTSPPSSSVPEPEVFEALRAIDGVSILAAREMADGATLIDLTFHQPVDHDNPDGPGFEQWVQLTHRDATAPTVLVDMGYTQYDEYEDPLTTFLDANQVQVEKRYEGTSVPDGDIDWTTMDTEQIAADTHAVVQALQPLYAGAWVGTGASLGGADTLAHRMDWPDDTVGTVAISPIAAFSLDDDRPTDWFAANLDADCVAKLTALQRLWLTRDADGGVRDTLEAELETETGGAFTWELDGGLDAALQNAVIDTGWNFWQFDGSADSCDTMPAASQAAAAIDFGVTWMYAAFGVPIYSDTDIISSYPTIYQDLHQQGYVHVPDAGYADLLDPDVPGFLDLLPESMPVPAFTSFSAELQDWVTHDADQVWIVNGDRDPWTSVRLSVDGATGDVHQATAPDTNHDAFEYTLDDADASALIADLEAWTGG